MRMFHHIYNLQILQPKKHLPEVASRSFGEALYSHGNEFEGLVLGAGEKYEMSIPLRLGRQKIS
jgi:NH3-dependent NAD+ synthetase